MLGFHVSERTISRWIKRVPRDPGPGKRWLAFLRNHKEAVAAMDFFTVPTVTFSVLYCFSATIADGFCTSTSLNTAPACGSSSNCGKLFPFDSAPRFLLFDSDAKYGRGSYRCSLLEHPSGSPTFERHWQNGMAERWVGSCRRDLLDHIIALNERHLKRLLSGFVRYYHGDLTHLAKQTPAGRIPSAASGRIVSHPGLGGLHHRYDRAA